MFENKALKVSVLVVGWNAFACGSEDDTQTEESLFGSGGAAGFAGAPPAPPGAGGVLSSGAGGFAAGGVVSNGGALTNGGASGASFGGASGVAGMGLGGFPPMGAGGAPVGSGGDVSIGGTAGSAGEAPDGSGGATSAPTFEQVFAIISDNCGGGFTGCHVDGESGGLLMPDAATAYANLVGIASEECPGETRVVAGDADASLLVKALEGTACVDQMPDRQPPLSADQIGTVRNWIDAGALNE